MEDQWFLLATFVGIDPNVKNLAGWDLLMAVMLCAIMFAFGACQVKRNKIRTRSYFLPLDNVPYVYLHGIGKTSDKKALERIFRKWKETHELTRGTFPSLLEDFRKAGLDFRVQDCTSEKLVLSGDKIR